LRAVGFEIDKASLDLESVEDYSPFHNAIEKGTTQSEPDVSASHFDSVRAGREISSIRSFVVTPIKVGTSVFGTLSFGSECEYNYSPAELFGFETIANFIGTALTNYRNAQRVNELLLRMHEWPSDLLPLRLHRQHAMKRVGV
jgi:GAF domain-containing protein